MLLSIDIETVANSEAVALMPEPEVKLGNVKDPAKIDAKIAEAKLAQVEKAALDPLTARIASYAVVGGVPGETKEYCEIIGAAADEASETKLVQSIFQMFGRKGVRLISWNGIGFDLPMIYKRALILGVDPANFGAPPLTKWTRRYSTDYHYDLMQVWGGWSSGNFVKLNTVAQLVLGKGKVDFDVTLIPELICSDAGREKLTEYNLEDARLTWELWQRFNGFLFE
jgi:DNA polymerase elongation subunit (family B)